MDTNSFLTVSQLSSELAAGETIIKFLVKRFKDWVPVTDQSGQKYYTVQSLITLTYLLDKINRGLLPSQIEKELESKTIQLGLQDISPCSHEQANNLMERRVTALEKIAEAEEKKALAIEKNLETEALKVDAMNNIANAILSINAVPVSNSNIEPGHEECKIDDLSLLLDPEIIVTDHAIDDLSMLIEQKNEKIDDLSMLLAPEGSKDLNSNDIDDLSALISDMDLKKDVKVKTDDLSLLIETDENQSKSNELDDLSVLIDFDKQIELKIQKPEFSPEDNFEKYKSEIINIIIDLKNQGSTEKETCEQFNKKGILTFSGKTKWSVKTISQIYNLIENAA